MSTLEIANILESSKELDLLRKQQEDVLTYINKLHTKLQNNPKIVEKPGDLSLSKLMNLYIQAKDLSEQEVRVSNILLTQLDALLPSRPPSQQQEQREGDNEDEQLQKENDSSPSMKNQLDNLSNAKVEQTLPTVTNEESDRDKYKGMQQMQYDMETEKYEVHNKEPSDAEKDDGQR